MRRRFDLIIFDNDGVLVDSETLGSRLLSQLISESGTPVSFDDAVHWYMGHPPSEIRTITRERLRIELADDFEERYAKAILDVFRQGLAPTPGIVDLLDSLGNIPVCVASNGDHERIRLALSVAGLLARFEGRIFSAQDVQRGKPAPDLFLFAADRMHATPDRCAVVEDSAAGIEAASSAGMISFGLATLAPYEALRKATGGVVSRPIELLPLLTATDLVPKSAATKPS